MHQVGNLYGPLLFAQVDSGMDDGRENIGHAVKPNRSFPLAGESEQ
jgi:hypothetical protein